MPRRLTYARRVAVMALALMAGPATVALAEQTCPGRNILDELATTSPALHTRVTAAAAATSNTGSVLWRIDRDGRPPSHLLGTIHLTDPRVTTLSDKLRSIIAGAARVALEVADLSPEATSAVMAKLGGLVVFDDGRRLDQLLTPEEIDKVEATLTASGVPAAAAPLFKPWVVTMMLAVSDCERRKVQNGKLVLDASIAALAQAGGKQIIGLETIESQLTAMASLPEADQIAILRASLEYVDRADDNMETLLQLYLDRKLGIVWPLQIALAEKVGIGRAAFDTFEQRLVVDRNRRMSEAALPLLEEGAALIAVGALHLPGEQGLVALLRKSGYTLTPVE